VPKKQMKRGGAQWIIDAPVPYAENLPRRRIGQIDTVVLHATEIPTLRESLRLARKITDGKTMDGICAHYYISRKGTLYRTVPDSRTANHCRGWNGRSIGIELVNRGRYPRWFHPAHQRFEQPYTESQYRTLNRLLRYLKKRYPRLRQCRPHSDLDRRRVLSTDGQTRVRRRIDPGPLFDWSKVIPLDGGEKT
jgi:N-acetylmuramoyl-L-alanine amidase